MFTQDDILTNKKGELYVPWKVVRKRMNPSLYQELIAYIHGHRQPLQGIFPGDIERFFSNRFGKLAGKCPNLPDKSRDKRYNV